MHIQRPGVLLEIPVGNHRTELKDKFLLFLVRGDVIGILMVIPLIRHPHFFFCGSHYVLLLFQKIISVSRLRSPLSARFPIRSFLRRSWR